MFSWIVGGLFAAGLAFIVGKIALGLRADYLAIATLLIAEIVVSIIKHEDWLARGVKNVIGLKRPAPYEIDLQTSQWFINLVEKLHSTKLAAINSLSEKQDLLNQLVIDASSVYVKLCFAGLFLSVVIILLILRSQALNYDQRKMLFKNRKRIILDRGSSWPDYEKAKPVLNSYGKAIELTIFFSIKN